MYSWVRWCVSLGSVLCAVYWNVSWWWWQLYSPLHNCGWGLDSGDVCVLLPQAAVAVVKGKHVPDCVGKVVLQVSLALGAAAQRKTLGGGVRGAGATMRCCGACSRSGSIYLDLNSQVQSYCCCIQQDFGPAAVYQNTVKRSEPLELSAKQRVQTF